MRHYLSFEIILISLLFFQAISAQEILKPTLKKIKGPVQGEVTLQISGAKLWDNIVLFCNGEEIGKANIQKKQWVYKWNTKKHSDGRHKITAQAEKNNKKYLSEPLMITTDNTPPTAKILPLLQKTYDKAFLRLNTSDKTSGIKEVMFWIDQKLLGYGKALKQKNIYQIKWDIPINSKGYHLLEAIIKDKADNVKKVVKKIRLDRRGPHIQVLEPLAQGATVGPLKCKAKITDPVGVKEVTFTLKGYPEYKAKVKYENNLWQAVWEKISDGPYQIIIKAMDNLGNRNIVNVYSRIDQTPPVLRWVNPTTNIITNKPIDIKIAASDKSNILSVTLHNKNHKPIHLKQTGDLWELRYVPQKEAKHELKAQVKDSAGNIENSKKIIVVYDVTKPKAELYIPKQDYFRDSFYAKVKALDELSGIDNVVYFLNDQRLNAKIDKDGYWKAKINVKKSGIYFLRAIISDKGGNVTKLKKVCLQIDKKSPSIELEPSDTLLSINEGRLKYKLKDNMSKILMLTLSINNKKIIEKINPELTGELIFDTSSLKEGEYSVIVEALDEAGNKGISKFLTIAIDRSVPKVISSITPKELQIGMVTVELDLEDKPAGINTKVKPNIFMKLNGKSYPFDIVSFSKDLCEADLLITSQHKIGEGTIYVNGIEDKAGHKIKETKLGKVTIKKVGGPWPLIPQNRVHPIIAAYDQNTPKNKSGIWIAATGKTPVKSIEDGKIFGIGMSGKNKPGYILIQRLRDKVIWGYYNIIIGKNITTNKFWTIGDMVKAGETIGNVALVNDSVQSYIYLELVTMKGNKCINVSSPINYLKPKAVDDFVSPFILYQAKKKINLVTKDLNFYIPLKYRNEQFKKNQYIFSDFLIVIYIIMFVATSLILLLYPKNFI